MTTAASFAWRAAVDVFTNPDYRFLRGAFLQWCSLARMRNGLPATTLLPRSPFLSIRQHLKEPVRELSLMRWGLIPSWAKDASAAASMINARSETASTKPAFRGALKSRRCLIPADGFYEWIEREKTKQPFCFEVNQGQLFAFAGVWDRWKDPNSNWIKTCSILTTTPNAVTAPSTTACPSSLIQTATICGSIPV